MFEAKIIAHSQAPSGAELVTLQLQYPRFIHSELMTHRVFSRNAMSSRAIPVAKMIQQVREAPAAPIHWGANQAGMQADVQLDAEKLQLAKARWLLAAESAAGHAEVMVEIGVHKQVANRLLEPFQWMRTIVTSTEWTNFFELRCHKDAQPEFQHLAVMMREAIRTSTPVKRPDVILDDEDPYLCVDAWHLPYVSDEERESFPVRELIKFSAARCARVSYLKHDGSTPNQLEDIKLFNRLVGSKPEHASPIEHQGYPDISPFTPSGNFRGWVQYRQRHATGAA